MLDLTATANKKTALVSFLTVILVVLVAWSAVNWARQTKLSELDGELKQLKQTLQAKLQHDQSIPELLEKSEVVLQALRSTSVDSIRAANHQGLEKAIVWGA
ncbi:MAG: hypothetical protein GKS05_09370 [Nitrospirales bacterium]|nr:hypothetical protein [Nitrospirales bacterium]